jgi:hypothetical protein
MAVLQLANHKPSNPRYLDIWGRSVIDLADALQAGITPIHCISGAYVEFLEHSTWRIIDHTRQDIVRIHRIQCCLAQCIAYLGVNEHVG